MENSDVIPVEYWWLYYPFGMDYVCSVVSEHGIMKGFASWLDEN